ncbi:acyl-homoserine-lactone synthase [Burkholderia oklahomensis]|uniref:acyl-homoserine-lactone synthase n=1 Tax=Burkholderia oklahomensis TaxID=342113 RepID=UPI00016A947A|nr:acyl-homoserine-lactone synthase [Burkholderia oklahomensis]AJX34422.1 autoinducer synthetase family protein [Burkholderia oklahomensis C6786]AOI48645.1 N-acyl homoserine lactone synthase [Burkholderia oklahomensis C6786]KUY47431.1 N-acyl homoserine lactone synthase [Burkholderia oklahomensis C6786]MBI0363173.1 GNAT family N-acetyltransferase [Burkholderia oklahomensis]SUY27286.1 Acyl-homoserine-lactone synthase [Burkholderia oklahomensis]
MSYIIAGRLNELPPHVQADLGAYRYDVFVRRLGWTIAAHARDDHAEWDEFDGPSTIHVVALDDARRVCGYARLLPTTGPYLLRDVFPHLLGSAPAPQSPTVWEMSRFAASRRRRRATERQPLGMDFFPSVLAVAASLGATRVVGVTSLSIERLYRRAGFALQRLGNTAPFAGGSISACSVELPRLAFAPFGRMQCASCMSMH